MSVSQAKANCEVAALLPQDLQCDKSELNHCSLSAKGCPARSYATGDVACHFFPSTTDRWCPFSDTRDHLFTRSQMYTRSRTEHILESHGLRFQQVHRV
jgi:hypothetical protein